MRYDGHFHLDTCNRRRDAFGSAFGSVLCLRNDLIFNRLRSCRSTFVVVSALPSLVQLVPVHIVHIV